MAQLMSIKKNVDVQPGVGVPAIFHCSQGDKGTRIILGLLNNNDSYTIPEGTTAIIRGSRADGTLFTEITADIDTTTEIKFNLTEDMTSVAGPVECEAVMTSGTANIIGTANFIIDVEKSPASIGSVFPATDAAETWLIDELTNLDISGLDDESVVDAINNKASESTIAPEFDPSGSYTAGSYVLKNGVLYTFTADHSGAWTGTDADVVTVGGEITDLKADLTIATQKGFISNEFEIGNITITASGWSYGDLKYRVRTKEGTTLSLKKGDKIGLSDYTDARYYIGWRHNGTYYYQGWLTADYTTRMDGDYVILIAHISSKLPENKYELLNLLFIHKRKSIYDLPWFNNGKMRIHAHKGLFGSVFGNDYVGNSIKSFENAGKHKIFMCETDVRQTSDNNLVCIHDATVDATTNGSGNVADMTLEQIRALKLLGQDGLPTDLIIPTFDEFLLICKKYNMIAVIELKDINKTGYVGRIVDKINYYGMETQCLLICSVYDITHFGVRSVTDLPVMLIAVTTNWNETFTYLTENDLLAVTCSVDAIDKNKIESCHRIRVPIDVFTTDSQNDADSYFNMGTDMITSNWLSESNWSI